jgi:hypothetical protein
MPWFWMGLGGLIGVFNGVSQIRLVAQIRPGADFKTYACVFRSYGLRFMLLLVGLTLAVRNGLVAALSMFFGLWLARWVNVLVGYTGLIDWSWFDVSSQGAG